jgi:hypothetical protein
MTMFSYHSASKTTARANAFMTTHTPLDGGVTHMSNLSKFASFILAPALLMTGCTGDVGDEPEPKPDVGEPAQQVQNDIPEGKSHVRVVHASADAPAVDIWVEGTGEPLIAGLSFGDTSEYLEVDYGTYDFQLRVSPSTIDDPIVYATGPIELADQHAVTTIAAGLIASTASADKFRVLAVTEGFGPAGSGSAIVRVVHAGADAPTVGIDLHDDDASAPEISNIDRFTSTDQAGFALNSGEAIQLGITAGGQRVTAFTTPELPEGAELFVIATGLVGELARNDDGFALLAVGPEGSIGFIKQNPVVYALHASPDAPPVDAFAGDAELLSLSFGELSGGLQIPPGDYTLDFYVSTPGSERPDGPPAVSANTGMVEPGQSYLTIATGLLAGGSNGFQLQSYAEGFDTSDDTQSRLRLVHSSPDAPAIDLGILNVEQVVNPVLFSNVSFPNDSAPEGLNSGIGQIPFGVTPAGANSTVVAAFHVTTAPGLRAFGVAAGALDSNNGQSFRLLVVNTTTAPWSVATVHPQP